VSKIEEILERATLLREGSFPVQEQYRKPPQSPEHNVYQVPKQEFKEVNSSLVTVNAPDSAVREEYQKLKSMLTKLTKTDEFKNVIMVTSALSGEGKSVTALNLAVTIAQEYDHTVLLVDADLRRPCIESYLGIKPGIGLSDCLEHDVEVSKALVKTGIGKLSILPAGAKVSNPVELLSSNKMCEFLQELKLRYKDRYIIVDTPPVLLFAEAHVIGSMVDGVIFVVREGQVPLQQLKEALNLMKGANILGVVYNDAAVTNSNSYSYYSKYQTRK